MRVGRSLPIESSLGSHQPSSLSPCPSDVPGPILFLCLASCHIIYHITQAPESQKPHSQVRPNCDVAPVLVPPHLSQWPSSTHDSDHLDSETARICLHSWGQRGVACVRDPLLPHLEPCYRLVMLVMFGTAGKAPPCFSRICFSSHSLAQLCPPGMVVVGTHLVTLGPLFLNSIQCQAETRNLLLPCHNCPLHFCLLFTPQHGLTGDKIPHNTSF